MTGCAGGLTGGLWAQYGAALEPGAALRARRARLRRAHARRARGHRRRGQARRADAAGQDRRRDRDPARGRPACRASRSSATRELDAFGARMLDLQRVLEADRPRRDRGSGRLSWPTSSDLYDYQRDGALDPRGHPPPEGNHRGVDRPLPRRWRSRRQPRRPALQPLQRAGLGRRARADAPQGPHARALRRGVHAGGAGPGRPARSRWRSPRQRAARRGAIKGGRAGAIQQASPTVAYVQISTPLENQDAAKQTPKLRKAIGAVPGATDLPDRLPALNHDTQPIYNKDLSKGESIAVPVAILVHGCSCSARSAAIVVPLLFALVTHPHDARPRVGLRPLRWTWPIYVTNIVTLIGFAIAIDYSMLVVFRYREELDAPRRPARRAGQTTMTTAGRATLFSGLTVASASALLVFMPLPFMRSMGVGGVLVPLVSIAASATFLPALLARDGTRREPLPRDPAQGARAPRRAGRHRRVAPLRPGRSCAGPVAAGAASRPAILIALALAAHRPAPDGRRQPRHRRSRTEAARGLKIMEATLGPGALAPASGGHRHRTGPAAVSTPAVVAAQRRLVAAAARATPRSSPTRSWRPSLVPARRGARRPNLVDRRGPHLPDPRRRPQRRRRAAGGRPRAPHPRPLHPGRRLPGARTDVLLTGAPAFGVDFIDKATAPSRGSCSRCSCSPTCCCCAPSARSSCRSRP